MERRKVAGRGQVVTVTGIACKTASECVDAAREIDGNACSLELADATGGVYMAISRAQMEKLETAGISPTTLHRVYVGGKPRIMSVPGNE